MTRRAEITREDTSRTTRCSWPSCSARGTYRFTGSDGFGGTVVGWLCESHAPERCPCGEHLPCALEDTGYPWCVNCSEHHRHPELCELGYYA